MYRNWAEAQAMLQEGMCRPGTRAVLGPTLASRKAACDGLLP